VGVSLADIQGPITPATLKRETSTVVTVKDGHTVVISGIITDEYTTHKAYKLAGDTIETVCGGHNGIETRMPVAFTKFVAERNEVVIMNPK
jgi:hypothetical protein